MSAPGLGWRAASWALLRWALGGLFLYAGLIKLQDTAALASSIARFQILPDFLIHLMALGLPPLEILCGTALGAGPWKRQAALGIVLLGALFLVALLSAAVRGIAVDCPCFGAAAAEPLWHLIGRDIFLLVGALTIYLRLLRGALSRPPEMSADSAVLNKPVSCRH